MCPTETRATDTCRACERLADIEAIKQLKARYFRLMDIQDWAGLGDVFTRDAVAQGGDQEVAGRAAVVDFISRASEGARSAHQGFLPEIEILEDGRARGIWAMQDYFEVSGTEPLVGFTGFGHYQDSYAIEDGAWRISASRLTRIKIIPLPGGLPAFYQQAAG